MQKSMKRGMSNRGSVSGAASKSRSVLVEEGIALAQFRVSEDVCFPFLNQLVPGKHRAFQRTNAHVNTYTHATLTHTHTHKHNTQVDDLRG